MGLSVVVVGPPVVVTAEAARAESLAAAAEEEEAEVAAPPVSVVGAVIWVVPVVRLEPGQTRRIGGILAMLLEPASTEETPNGHRSSEAIVVAAVAAATHLAENEAEAVVVGMEFDQRQRDR